MDFQEDSQHCGTAYSIENLIAEYSVLFTVFPVFNSGNTMINLQFDISTYSLIAAKLIPNELNFFFPFFFFFWLKR